VFARMDLVAIALFASGVILKYGFDGSGVVGVVAMEVGGSGGREVIFCFGGWASGR